MSAGARTIRPLASLMETRALPPPPTRHALLVFLLVLAAILHLCTAGWSEIHNGAEGQYAGSARQMAQTGQTDGATLLHYLIFASYKLFGVSPAAARFPIAIAMIASVALTFLIGERLRDYWHGFVAGLIHLCSLGSFTWGRVVTPVSLLAVALAGALFCAVCGYQNQRGRPLYFAGAAVCAAFAWMCEGLLGLFYVVAILLLLAIFFREARMRFVQILRWPNILIFLALVIAWQMATQSPLSNSSAAEGLPVLRFVARHGAWWFPALLLVIPGVLLAARKVFRPYDFDFADALPLCWMAVGFLPVLFFPHRQDYDSMMMWGGFALWAATVWERMPLRLRLVGLGVVFVIGVALFAAAIFPLERFRGIQHTMLFAASLGLICAAGLAAYFAAREREVLAISILMLGMVPVGLSAAESMARLGPHFSLASAAQFLKPRLGEAGEVLYEGPAFAASSLGFYLDRPFRLVQDDASVENFAAPHPVYLIIRRERVTYWQEQLTERFHLFHLETTCGPHVVVSNQP